MINNDFRLHRHSFIIYLLMFLLVCHRVMSVTPPAIQWQEANTTNYIVANRVTDKEIQYIVLHATPQAYSDTIKLYKRKLSNASSHYVINNHMSPWFEDDHFPDGQITQMVKDKDIALKPDTLSDSKFQSIEIDHSMGESPRQLSFQMYRESAKLVAYLSTQYNIPVNRSHILLHDSIEDNEVDTWDWDMYMTLVKSNIAGICQWPEFDIGDSGRSVMTLQMLLSDRVPTNVTGTFTENTEQSLKLFRESINSITNAPSPFNMSNIWEHLVSKYGEISLNETRNVVKVIQFLLSDRFHYLNSSRILSWGKVDQLTLDTLRQFKLDFLGNDTTVGEYYSESLDLDTWALLVTGWTTPNITNTSPSSPNTDATRNIRLISMSVVFLVCLALLGLIASMTYMKVSMRRGRGLVWRDNYQDLQNPTLAG